MQNTPHLPSLSLVAALLITCPAWSHTEAHTSLYEAREKDWRNGAVVYQILADRFELSVIHPAANHPGPGARRTEHHGGCPVTEKIKVANASLMNGPPW